MGFLDSLFGGGGRSQKTKTSGWQKTKSTGKQELEPYAYAYMLRMLSPQGAEPWARELIAKRLGEGEADRLMGLGGGLEEGIPEDVKRVMYEKERESLEPQFVALRGQTRQQFAKLGSAGSGLANSIERRLTSEFLDSLARTKTDVEMQSEMKRIEDRYKKFGALAPAFGSQVEQINETNYWSKSKGGQGGTGIQDILGGFSGIGGMISNLFNRGGR